MMFMSMDVMHCIYGFRVLSVLTNCTHYAGNEFCERLAYYGCAA
jgi:hypothetical protein